VIPLSFEFFPPNTPVGEQRLREVREQLAVWAPQFYSVTYGAGGATRAKTESTVLEIAAAGCTVAPHLSCVGANRDGISELLEGWRARGIDRIVALRGDLPSGMVQGGEFRYAADLVAFVRERFGSWFHIEVAAYPEMHPQARNAEADLSAFVAKMNAGANSAITQFFYNADAYFAFVDAARARGVQAPIVPGVMPIQAYFKVARFAESCGAEIPRWIARRMEAYGDDVASVRAFGLDVVSTMCERLLAGGAPALHFYTLNQADLCAQVLSRLSSAPSSAPRASALAP
jgi:methylenetetrahydrofolate reductase (NADPH)